MRRVHVVEAIYDLMEHDMTQRKSAENFDISGVIARRTAEKLDNLVLDGKSERTIRSCKNCLTPETEQSVKFDEHGICNICLVAQERDTEVDWEERLAELERTIEQFRGKYTYDAIVPFSGGKDSAWTAYVLRKRFDLKVLLVTFDSHFRRPQHLENMERVVRELGCEQVTMKAADDVIKKTMKESLKRRGDYCWFCHTGVVASPFKAALMYKVPLIIWGEPGTEQSGGYFNYKTKTPPDERWFNRQINLSINAEDMAGFIDGVELRDLEPFRMPEWQELMDMGVTSIHLGDYIKWDAPKQYEILNKELGWEMSEVENLHPRYHYEKVECYLQGTRDYLRFIKRGYSRTMQRANIDIRNGVLTRKEAEEMIWYDQQRPASLDNILAYLDMDEQEFMDIALDHQVYPHRHEPNLIKMAQSSLPDEELWTERLKSNVKNAKP